MQKWWLKKLTEGPQASTCEFEFQWLSNVREIFNITKLFSIFRLFPPCQQFCVVLLLFNSNKLNHVQVYTTLMKWTLIRLNTSDAVLSLLTINCQFVLFHFQCTALKSRTSHLSLPLSHNKPLLCLTSFDHSALHHYADVTHLHKQFDHCHWLHPRFMHYSCRGKH